ncbi:MAG: hypothetical protein H0T80_09090 [Betaproteobacteria bacterium]|nr:hypothetical protein [Betaproteobacteria bacterium]
MSAAPFVVVVSPDKRNNVKGYRAHYATAIDAEREAARLRSLGWTAYAEEQKRSEKNDGRDCARTAP